MKPKNEIYSNKNTSYRLFWSRINQAWMVWREDTEHQTGVRVFNDYQEAKELFDEHVSFYKTMLKA